MFSLCTLLAAMAANAPASEGLTVHEWGTFTCFVGADSKARPIQIDVGSDLPSFVMTRPRWVGKSDEHAMLTSGKAAHAARQRMETPVLYFYSQKPVTVDVRVDLPEGLVTEFFPRPSAVTPEFGALELEKCGGAGIEWKSVRVLASQEGGEPLAITQKSHYAAARETDASLIAVKDSSGAETFEKFLFYRGMADFESPVMVRQQRGDVTLRADSGDLPYAVLVNVRDGVLRAKSIGAARGEFTLSLGAAPASVDDLAREFAAALVKEGLFEREAVSMVTTWRDLWFGEPGTRVLYILPEGLPDGLLPLKIEPAPDSLDRVFVGRVELLTDDDRAWFEGATAKARALGATPDEIRAAMYPQAAPRFGRFARPAVEELSRP